MTAQSVRRVLVVAGSTAGRRALRGALLDRHLLPAGDTAPGQGLVRAVGRLQPDVVLVDLGLPEEQLLDVIESVMAGAPTPVVAYAPRPVPADLVARVRAAGAVDVVAADQAAQLCPRLLLAARVRAITHPRGRLQSRLGGHAPLPRQLGAEQRELEPVEPPAPAAGPVRLVAIGASTGGPAALAAVLGSLPDSFSAAVLVVQHMAEGFLEGLADWLDNRCAVAVRIGRPGLVLTPGTVVLAPSGANTGVDQRLRVVCSPAAAGQHHVPSVDVAFCSVAERVGATAAGVLLTGMGRDGAAGLAAIRAAGGVTIAQDESTCAVYGMPAAASALGAVQYERPLEAIGPALVQLVAGQEVA